MHRPDPGPFWPPADDTVENSLRRAYLRATPRPQPDSDRFAELLRSLSEALGRADPPPPRHDARQSA